MSTKKKRWLRDKLFKENPYCRCGVEMIHPSDLPTDHNGRIKHFPENTCMLKRKFSKYQAWERVHNKETAQLMCKKCVSQLSRKDEGAVDIEIKRIRSKPVKKLTKY